jgi:hypothetical protein
MVGATLMDTAIDREVNPAQNTRWIRRMTTAPSIKGHKLQRGAATAWCECGYYCGATTSRVVQHGGADHIEPADDVNTRHDLHRVIIGR